MVAARFLASVKARVLLKWARQDLERGEISCGSMRKDARCGFDIPLLKQKARTPIHIYLLGSHLQACQPEQACLRAHAKSWWKEGISYHTLTRATGEPFAHVHWTQRVFFGATDVSAEFDKYWSLLLSLELYATSQRTACVCLAF